MTLNERWKAESSIAGKILMIIPPAIILITELLQYLEVVPASVVPLELKQKLSVILGLMMLIGKFTVKTISDDK